MAQAIVSDPPHGTRMRYERDKCRCDLCRSENARRHREYMDGRTPRLKGPPKAPEAKWMARVREFAEYHGWGWVHPSNSVPAGRGFFRPSLTGPLGAGWPDLVLVRDRVIFVELKSRYGKVREDQAAVLKALRTAGAEVYVWRPQDWEEATVALLPDPLP